MFYFTPPYEMSVLTRVGSEFIKIVKEEFPPDHPYHHILNEHTIKVGYSVMPSLKKKITYHNVKITNQMEEDNKKKKKNAANNPKVVAPVAVVEDEEEYEYDPKEEINHELEEVVIDIDPIMPAVPVPVNARACDVCVEDCGGLILLPLTPEQNI